MKNLVINYDMIDKIYQAKGEHKLRRNFKILNKFATPMLIGTGLGGILAVSLGRLDVDAALWQFIKMNSIVYGSGLVLMPILNKKVENIMRQTLEEAGFETLEKLSQKFNFYDINTTPNLLLDSKVYHKRYTLAKEGIPGIIRERYIRVPIYNHNGIETSTSIKEEHLIGSHKYVLSSGKYEKQKQLKLSYGV